MKVFRGALCALAVAVAACGDDNGPSDEGRRIVGVDAANTLVLFSDGSADNVTTRQISGLVGSDVIVGIDFNAVDGRLYALGRANYVYAIDTTTGVASQTVLGAAAFTPALTGTSFGFDFNPVVDRIRVHGENAQNLRLNQITSAVAGVDGNLTYAAGDANAAATPALFASAYTNNDVDAATATTLYAIDAALDVLVQFAVPNDGIAATVGTLGVNTTNSAGFDIFDAGNTAYAALTVDGQSQSGLYSVNLSSGAATLISTIGHTSALVGIAVSQ